MEIPDLDRETMFGMLSDRQRIAFWANSSKRPLYIKQWFISGNNYMRADKLERVCSVETTNSKETLQGEIFRQPAWDYEADEESTEWFFALVLDDNALRREFGKELDFST